MSFQTVYSLEEHTYLKPVLRKANTTMMDQEDTMAAIAPQRKKFRALRWMRVKSKAKARLLEKNAADSSPKTVDVESDSSLATDKEDSAAMLDVAPETTPPVMDATEDDHRQEESPSEMEMLAGFLADFGSCRCVDHVDVEELSAMKGLNCAGGLA